MGAVLARYTDGGDDLVQGRAPRERRKTARHRTVFQTAKLTTTHGEELCILRDISTDGLRADVYCGLEVDEPVEVQLRTGREVSGRVVWSQDGSIGVAFLEPVPIFSYLAHQAVLTLGRKVRPPRITIDERAVMIADRREFGVTICNASQAGMGVVTDRVLCPGAHCELVINAIGRRGAMVRWCGNGHVGVQLKTPLDFAQFASWRTHH